jgi:hypothetical protein
MSEKMRRNNCFGQGLWLCLSIAALASLAGLMACTLQVPANLLDKIDGSVTVTNLKNANSGFVGDLYSGVVAGTLAEGAASAKVSFDDLPFEAALVNVNKWRAFRPTGSAASQGHRHWQPGSRHRLRVRPCNSAGDCKRETIDVTFTVQENRDVNGDGYADLAVATGAEGKAYIFESQGGLGIASANDINAKTILTGLGGQFGFSVSLGDVNGDGYADLAVGDLISRDAHIFHSQGKDGILTGTSATANSKITSSVGSSSFGYKVLLSDINGDGFADLIVGSPGEATSMGKAYIFHSRGASGIVTGNETLADTSITGTTVTGSLSNVFAAGDLNGDGFSDITFGVPTQGGNLGRAIIFHSSGANGIASGLDTSATRAIDGTVPSGEFGRALDMGDTNGDEIEDLAVSGRGAVYMFHAQFSGGVTASFDSDATHALTKTPVADFGAVIALGDITGDGFADVAVSNPQDTSYQGVVHIFHSSGTGGITSTTTAGAATALTGIGSDYNAGIALGYFDANGDGIADLAIGSWGGADGDGVAAVFHGSQPAGIASGSLLGANATLTTTLTASGIVFGSGF